MPAWVGCTEPASRFGDEIAFHADAHRTEAAPACRTRSGTNPARMTVPRQGCCFAGVDD